MYLQIDCINIFRSQLVLAFVLVAHSCNLKLYVIDMILKGLYISTYTQSTLTAAMTWPVTERLNTRNGIGAYTFLAQVCIQP